MTVIMTFFGQIEQSVHYIGKSMIYSMRRVFPDCTVGELSINLTRSPTANV